MKFDDKLLPSENDLSQNEYKTVPPHFLSLQPYANVEWHKNNIYVIVFAAYCELGGAYMMLPIMLYEQ